MASRKALTPKALNTTAQGRESASAPWVVWAMESVVESKGDAVAKASAYVCFGVSPSVAQYPHAMLRFHLPLIEPDVRISRIRLSDKVSRVRPRKGLRTRRQLDESQRSIQVLDREP